MTTMTAEWTRQDSQDLDLYAQMHYVTPLRRDPQLWELFEQDRQEAPRVVPKAVNRHHGMVVPDFCRSCHKPMRSRRVKSEARPGTVGHCGRGYCDACYHQIVKRGRAE